MIPNTRQVDPRIFWNVHMELKETGKVEKSICSAKSISNHAERGHALRNIFIVLKQGGKLEDAKDVANSLPDSVQRCDALQQIALEVAQATLDPAETTKRLARRVSLASSEECPPQPQTNSLPGDGDLEKGLANARLLDNPEKRFSAIQDLYEKLTNSSDANYAVNVALSQGSNEDERWAAHQGVARALAKQGNPESAIAVTALIKGNSSHPGDAELRKGSTLWLIGKDVVQAGAVDEGRSAIELIPHATQRENALFDVLKV